MHRCGYIPKKLCVRNQEVGQIWLVCCRLPTLGQEETEVPFLSPSSIHSLLLSLNAKWISWKHHILRLPKTGRHFHWALTKSALLKNNLRNSSQCCPWGSARPRSLPWLLPSQQMTLKDSGTPASNVGRLGQNWAPPMSPQSRPPTSGPRNASPWYAPLKSHHCHWESPHVLDLVLLLIFSSHTSL